MTPPTTKTIPQLRPKRPPLLLGACDECSVRPWVYSGTRPNGGGRYKLCAVCRNGLIRKLPAPPVSPTAPRP